MNHPAAATRYTWQSGPLIPQARDQEYRFAIRIAAAPWPGVYPELRRGGHETQNTDTHAATADTDAPVAPGLTAQLV